MNRRRADAKKLLHVGFGRGLAVQTRVEVDKRQILTLLGREVFCRVTQAGHPDSAVRPCLARGGGIDEFTLSGRTEPNRAQRTRDAFERRRARRRASSSGRRFCRPLTRGSGDDDIANSVGGGGSTVYRTKQRFVFDNLEAALSEAPRPGASRKLWGKEEALLVATACSKPPEGRARWTLELLAGELVTAHDSLSRKTVRRRLPRSAVAKAAAKERLGPDTEASYEARLRSGGSSSILAKRTQNIGNISKS